MEEEIFYTSCEDEELEVQAKANLCLMAIDDEVCNDDELDDYEILHDEYEGLLVDFEKLLHKCTKYRKTITSLNLELENAKKDYEVVLEGKKKLQIDFDSEKSINEVLELELERKSKTLDECMNENVELKLSIDKKLKHCNHDCLKDDNRQCRKKHAYITCYNCGRKGHISHYYSFNRNISSTMKRIWVPKGSHVLTNHKGPIKAWVPKSST